MQLDTSKFKLWIDVENNPEDFGTWYVKLSTIEKAYKYWWYMMRSTNVEPFTCEKYDSCFDEAGLKIIFDSRLDPDGVTTEPLKTYWVVGIKSV